MNELYTLRTVISQCEDLFSVRSAWSKDCVESIISFIMLSRTIENTFAETDSRVMTLLVLPSLEVPFFGNFPVTSLVPSPGTHCLVRTLFNNAFSSFTMVWPASFNNSAGSSSSPRALLLLYHQEQKWKQQNFRNKNSSLHSVFSVVPIGK